MLLPRPRPPPRLHSPADIGVCHPPCTGWESGRAGEGANGAAQLHLRSVRCGSRRRPLPLALAAALVQTVFARPTSRPCVYRCARPAGAFDAPRVPLQHCRQTRGGRMEVEAAAPLPEPPVLKRPAEPAEKEDGSPVPKK